MIKRFHHECKNTYWAYKSRGTESVILTYYPDGYWNAAIGGFGVSGDLPSVVDEMRNWLAPSMKELSFEVYDDDLMIIQTGKMTYEFLSFSLLIRWCGTLEEILERFRVNRRHRPDLFSDIFYYCEENDFAPNTMVKMFYTMMKGGDQ